MLFSKVVRKQECCFQPKIYDFDIFFYVRLCKIAEVIRSKSIQKVRFWVENASIIYVELWEKSTESSQFFFLELREFLGIVNFFSWNCKLFPGIANCFSGNVFSILFWN